MFSQKNASDRTGFFSFFSLGWFLIRTFERPVLSHEEIKSLRISVLFFVLNKELPGSARHYDLQFYRPVKSS